MDEEEETELSRVDSWMQSSVPSIPKFFAIICLVLNIIIPGSGTFAGGLFSCCCGRPRIEFRPAQYRCPVAMLVMIIGILQFLATGFFLVGWLWSIIWGFLMVNLSGEEFRKMAPPPEVLPPPGAPQRRASKVSVQIEESAPPGKKNFGKLINKASENKDMALHGSGSTVSIPKASKDPKDSKGSKKPNDSKDNKSQGSTGKLAPKELHTGKLNLPSQASTPKASSSKSVSSTPSKTSQGRASPTGSSSIFSCFSQKHQKFITEKLEKFLIRGQSESTSDLLGAVDSDSRISFKSTAHRLFHHWRVQARKLAKLRIGEDGRVRISPILVSSQSSVRDSAGTPNSVHFELPNEEVASPIPLPLPQETNEQDNEQVILDPSKLASGRNNPKITVVKPSPDTVADEETRQQSPPLHEDMKPRIMQSQTYHFAV